MEASRVDVSALIFDMVTKDQILCGNVNSTQWLVTEYKASNQPGEVSCFRRSPRKSGSVVEQSPQWPSLDVCPLPAAGAALSLPVI